MIERHPDDRPTHDADRPCPHENFWCDVDVQRITKTDDGPVVGYAAEIRIRCVDCSEPFAFRGLPIGLSSAHPTGSLDGLELRVPIAPATDRDAGDHLPGFAIRILGENAGRGLPGVDTSNPDDHGRL